MLWYGFLNISKVKTHITRLKIRRNTRNTIQPKPQDISVRANNLTTLKQVSITSEFQFIGIKHLCAFNHSILLYLYNNIYFINLLASFKLHAVQFETQTFSFVFDSYVLFPQWLSYLRHFTILIMRFTTPTFLKLKFRGKGYYLYKNFRKVITPQFGYSHRLYFYIYLASFTFLTKTKILFFGLSLINVIKLSNLIKTIRPANIFTGRGMRFSRQVFYRKIGKVSTYR